MPGMASQRPSAHPRRGRIEMPDTTNAVAGVMLAPSIERDESTGSENTRPSMRPKENRCRLSKLKCPDRLDAIGRSTAIDEHQINRLKKIMLTIGTMDLCGRSR